MKRFLLLCTFFICTQFIFAQAVADTTMPRISIRAVDATDISNAAKKSGKKYTLFYTFGIWCEPCVLHLPTAIKLAKDYDMEFYVLLVDAQESKRTPPAASYIYELDKNIKIAILRDAVYGDKTKKRNKKFVTEITPPQFENIDDFSKYIVLDAEGKVIMVTNYKDNPGDWKDDSDMVKSRIVPLLK